jgi:hypothetical protein
MLRLLIELVWKLFLSSPLVPPIAPTLFLTLLPHRWQDFWLLQANARRGGGSIQS